MAEEMAEVVLEDSFVVESLAHQDQVNRDLVHQELAHQGSVDLVVEPKVDLVGLSYLAMMVLQSLVEI